MNKFVVLNTNYGYYNQDGGFTSFNLEDAALYTEKSIKENHINTNNPNENIIIEYTKDDLSKLPFTLPDAKEKDLKIEPSNKYVIMDKNYGYYDQEGQFSGFDLEYAGLYDDKLAKEYNIDIDSDNVITTSMSKNQLSNMPFVIQEAKVKKQNLLSFDDLQSTNVSNKSLDDIFKL